MADDSFIPAESLEAFKSALDSVNANYEYIAYPGVKHSFTSKTAPPMTETRRGLSVRYMPRPR